MVAQVRGVKFDEYARPDDPDEARRSLWDVVVHLAFMTDAEIIRCDERRFALYLRALAKLKSAIFDRPTRTKWVREHSTVSKPQEERHG